MTDLYEVRSSLLRSQAAVVAEEPRVKAVVATEEVSPETVLGVARDLRGSLKCDLLLVTDGRGRLLADAASPGASGHDMTDKPLVADALSRGEGAGVWLDDKHAYQMTAKRIAFGESVVGVVILGYRIGEEVAGTMQRQTGSSAAILRGERVLAVSLEEGAEWPADALATALARVPVGSAEPVEADVAGQVALAVGDGYPGYAGDERLRYVLFRSLDRAEAPGRTLTLILLGILLLANVAAIPLALALSRRLSRPLDELVRFTKKVGTGDLSERAEIVGPIELRTLGEAMNQMAGQLQRSQGELAAKERLEQELEIAVRIQTTILPKNLQVEGLEIAARMLPASEVGGDYYDVIRCDSGCWIGIGDVAGHGLTAGVVMMMVQSVVSAVVRAKPDATPRDAVEVLNGVMYENIRERLEHDEHVTLSLLRFRPDGRVNFSGAHEDIVICRAATGRCERIRTEGTWIGGMRDIGRFLRDSSCQLQKGDVMVLYTDGITEAQDARDEQYGMDRLCELVERLREEPAERIRDGVLDAATSWAAAQSDDMTIVVLRYTG
jgi:sigma-B regulation protein RsbU (phosphoserine phosphatase)